MTEPQTWTKPSIPDFEVLRPIARGAYGEVWLAQTSVSRVYRAIKVVTKARFGQDSRPFYRELEGLSRFHRLADGHPRQLAILHVARHPSGDLFYYVMELADNLAGGKEFDPDRYEPSTLTAFRARTGPSPAIECLRWSIEIVEALAELHDVVGPHRDLKPSNIILVGGVLKIADIGLVASSDGSTTGQGTPTYAAPEGNGTRAADIYGVGKVIWFLFCGTVDDFPSFPSTPEYASVARDPVFKAVNALIDTACHPDPSLRFASARDLLRELRRIEAGRQAIIERNLKRLQIFTKAAAILLAVALLGYGYRVVQAQRHEIDYQEYSQGMQSAFDHVQRGEVTRANRILGDLAHNPLALGQPVEQRILRELTRPRPIEFLEQQAALKDLAMSDDQSLLAVLRQSSSTNISEALVLQGPDWGQPINIGPARALVGFAPQSRDVMVYLDEPGNLGIEGHRVYRVDPFNPGSRRKIGPPKVSLFSATDDRRWLLLLMYDKGLDRYVFRVWDVILDTAVATWDFSPHAPNSKELVAAVASCSETGKDGLFAKVAVCMKSQTGSHHDFDLLIWDSSTGRVVQTKGLGHGKAMHFSPDGRFLAMADASGPIPLLDARDATVVRTLHGHRGSVSALRFSPDSKSLASTGEDGTARTWRIEQGGVPNSVFGLHEPSGNSVKWDASGGAQHVLSVGDEGSVRRSTPGAREDRWLPELYRYILGDFLVSADASKVLATTKEGVTGLFDSGSLEERRRYPGVFQPLGWLPGASDFLALGTNYSLLQVNLETGAQQPLGLQMPSLTDSVERIVASPSMGFVALLQRLEHEGTGNTLTVWDVNLRRPVVTGKSYGTPILTVAFLDDETLLLGMGSNIHRARIEELESSQPGPVIATCTAKVECIVASPRQTHVALGTMAGTIHYLDLARPGASARVVQAHSGPVWSLCFTSDGTRLLSGGGDGKLAFWALPEFRHLASFHVPAPASDADFDPKIVPLRFSADEGLLGAWIADGRLLMLPTRPRAASAR